MEGHHGYECKKTPEEGALLKGDSPKQEETPAKKTGTSSNQTQVLASGTETGQDYDSDYDICGV